MPFPVPTPIEIKEALDSEIESNFPSSDPKVQPGLFNTISKAVSLVTHGLYIYQDWISRQPFASTADDEQLDIIGTEIAIDRKEATAASGDVDCTGVDTSIIPVGAELVSSTGVTYTVTVGATITAGVATITVASVTFGLETNQDVGVKINFVSPVSGVDSLALVATGGLIGGTDRETDDVYRDRIIQRKRNPLQCGSITDYEIWAKQVPGVTRAFVFPQEAGPGSVTVRFMMDDTYTDGIPLAGDVATVQAYIESQMPINVVLSVSAPIAVPTDIDVRVTPATADVIAAVGLELDDLFFRDSTPGGGLFLSRIREAVSSASGEQNNIVDDPTADVTTASDAEILVPGTYSITAI